MEKDEIYFYAGSTNHSEGNIIAPGNWGNIIFQTPIKDYPNFYNLLFESTLEMVRVSLTPHLPSRMKCNFFCETEKECRDFIQITNRASDAVYEIELTEPKFQVFKTDWSLIDLFSGEKSLAQWIPIAHQYWNPAPENIEHVELLSISPMKIRRKLS